MERYPDRLFLQESYQGFVDIRIIIRQRAKTIVREFIDLIRDIFGYGHTFSRIEWESAVRFVETELLEGYFRQLREVDIGRRELEFPGYL